MTDINRKALPRPEYASIWTLDPEFVLRVTNEIRHTHGWDAEMEVVELAMLAAERTLIAQGREDGEGV